MHKTHVFMHFFVNKCIFFKNFMNIIIFFLDYLVIKLYNYKQELSWEFI